MGWDGNCSARMEDAHHQLSQERQWEEVLL